MPGEILINPDVFQDKRDALAVAWDEALRLAMEDMRFTPKFAVTAAQAKFFKGTAYATDPVALNRTIVARIATHDTSVTPTPEQEQETVQFLDRVYEMIGTAHPDAASVKKLRESVAAGGARGPVEAPIQPDPEEVPDIEPPAPPVEQVAPEAPVEPAPPAEQAMAAMKGGKTRPPPTAMDIYRRQRTIDHVLAALLYAEGARSDADVGDNGRAVGRYQMHVTAVEEANRVVGRKIWSPEDRANPQLSRAMAKVILEHRYDRGTTDPVTLGGTWRNPDGSAPKWYLDKVRAGLPTK
jgi:hypothetical protein